MKEEVERTVEEDGVVDKSKFVDISVSVREQVKNILLKSAAIKIGFMQGFKDTNDCLKDQFGVEMEFDTDEFLEQINKVNSLEIHLLSIQGMNCGDEIKKELTELALQNFYQPKEQQVKKENPLLSMLKKEVDRIYKSYGELPSPDINEVRRPNQVVKNNEEQLVKEKKVKNVTNRKNRSQKHSST